MLSPRIDLTEHRDFGGGRIIQLQDELVSTWFDGGLMTNDEYEYVVWWESIFGRTRHVNRKREIFHKDDLFYERKMIGHCQRCGREIKIPWKNFFGLCEECNEDVSYDVKKIPWKVYQGSRRTTPRDLFNLR